MRWFSMFFGENGFVTLNVTSITTGSEVVVSPPAGTVPSTYEGLEGFINVRTDLSALVLWIKAQVRV